MAEHETTARISKRPWHERPRARLLCLLGPVLYIAGAAASQGETRASTWLWLGTAAFVALLGADLRPQAPTLVGSEEERTRGRFATAAGLTFTLAAAGLVHRTAWASCLAEIGAALSVWSAARAMDRIERDPGLAGRASEVEARRFGMRTLARVTSTASLVGWGAAALVDALVWLRVSPSLADDALVLASTLGALSLSLLVVTALLTAGARRLELGAPPRLLACAGAGGAGLVIALVLALGNTLRTDSAVALGAAGSAMLVVRIAHARRAMVVARRGRRLLTLLLFGGPVVTLGAIAAAGQAPHFGIVAMSIAAATMLIGALAPKLEEPLLPARGQLLTALLEAARAVRECPPENAVADALVRIRSAVGAHASSPEIWMVQPMRFFTADAAGYAREHAGELPEGLVSIAREEPEFTVRTDVLEALQVRRPDLRSYRTWLSDRGALSATLIADGEDVDGMIIVPRGMRNDPLTIEEVHAVKKLADALLAICRAEGARARHLERERELARRIESLDDELLRLAHVSAIEAGKNELAAARLARPATVGIYSAVSRFAFDALTRRIEQHAPVVLLARAGIDPVPYIARAHLSGPRKDFPLVVVDGTSTREHDVTRWCDSKVSPLALADGGLLVLVDGAALPNDVQLVIARSLRERRPPWERATPLDIAVAFTDRRSPDALLEEGRLTEDLHTRFEGASPIELPGLRDRSEDLFSIVADRLAREGLRARGRPLGIDQAAFARLVEHPFEGEDIELSSLVARLVANAKGDVIRASDVDAALGNDFSARDKTASR